MPARRRIAAARRPASFQLALMRWPALAIRLDMVPKALTTPMLGRDGKVHLGIAFDVLVMGSGG